MTPTQQRRKFTAAKLFSTGQSGSAIDGRSAFGKGMRGNTQHILRFDNEAPSRPYRARGRQGEVLRKREIFGWSAEVGDAGEDDCPLSAFNILHPNYYGLWMVQPSLPEPLIYLSIRVCDWNCVARDVTRNAPSSHQRGYSISSGKYPVLEEPLWHRWFGPVVLRVSASIFSQL